MDFRGKEGGGGLILSMCILYTIQEAIKYQTCLLLLPGLINGALQLIAVASLCACMCVLVSVLIVIGG